MTVTIPTMAMNVYNDFTDEDDGDHDDGVPSEHDDQRNQNNLINNGNSEYCYANDEENNDKTTVSITVYYSTRVNSKFLICIGHVVALSFFLPLSSYHQTTTRSTLFMSYFPNDRFIPVYILLAGLPGFAQRNYVNLCIPFSHNLFSLFSRQLSIPQTIDEILTT